MPYILTTPTSNTPYFTPESDFYATPNSEFYSTPISSDHIPQPNNPQPNPQPNPPIASPHTPPPIASPHTPPHTPPPIASPHTPLHTPPQHVVVDTTPTQNITLNAPPNAPPHTNPSPHTTTTPTIPIKELKATDSHASELSNGSSVYFTPKSSFGSSDHSVHSTTSEYSDNLNSQNNSTNSLNSSTNSSTSNLSAYSSLGNESGIIKEHITPVMASPAVAHIETETSPALMSYKSNLSRPISHSNSMETFRTKLNSLNTGERKKVSFSEHNSPHSPALKSNDVPISILKKSPSSESIRSTKFVDPKPALYKEVKELTEILPRAFERKHKLGSLERKFPPVPHTLS